MATVEQKRAVKPIHYPESDGKPIAETPIHFANLGGLIQMLKDYYLEDETAYVSGNMFMYYVEGDPRKAISPDVFVALGVGRKIRRIYCTWLEGGKSPDLVVEVTSPKTRKEDATKKFLIYQDILKVREYFRFDPLGEYLKPALQGLRLVDGQYIPIEPVDGRVPSEVTGLHFFQEGTDLKLTDPRTGRIFLTLEESIRELLDDQARQTPAERDRADDQDRQTQAERTRADAAEAQAQAERVRADEASSELERIRRELEEFRKLQGGA
jgi:Uma2 family endonuclease